MLEYDSIKAAGEHMQQICICTYISADLLLVMCDIAQSKSHVASLLPQRDLIATEGVSSLSVF